MVISTTCSMICKLGDGSHVIFFLYLISICEIVVIRILLSIKTTFRTFFALISSPIVSIGKPISIWTMTTNAFSKKKKKLFQFGSVLRIFGLSILAKLVIVAIRKCALRRRRRNVWDAFAVCASHRGICVCVCCKSIVNTEPVDTCFVSMADRRSDFGRRRNISNRFYHLYLLVWRSITGFVWRSWQPSRYELCCVCDKKNYDKLSRSTAWCVEIDENVQLQDAIVIIFDVGTNAVESDMGDGPFFFEQAKNCIKSIILTKVKIRFVHFNTRFIEITIFIRSCSPNRKMKCHCY